MKRITSLLMVCILAITMVVGVTGCGKNKEESTTKKEKKTTEAVTEKTETETILETETESETESESVSDEATTEAKVGAGKTLVVYFTLAHNTVKKNDTAASSTKNQNKSFNSEYLAGIVKNYTDADVFEILVKDKYPADYDDVTDQAQEEQANNTVPKLKTKVANMDDYDNVFLIYPIWWGTLPTPVVSFINGYDFSGKTIYPISSSEGSGIESSVEDIKTLASKAEVDEGLSVMASNVASSKNIVEQYLKNKLK